MATVCQVARSFDEQFGHLAVTAKLASHRFIFLFICKQFPTCCLPLNFNSVWDDVASVRMSKMTRRFVSD